MKFNNLFTTRFVTTTMTTAVISSCVLMHATATAENETPTFNELSTIPTTIFVGRVVELTPRRTSSDYIITRVTFDVDHLVVGQKNAKEQIVIEQLGGTEGGDTLSVCCQPKWELGERYLVFAEDPSVLLTTPTLGALEGVFHVVEGSDGVSYPLAWGYRPITGLRNGYLRPSVRATNLSQGVATLYREPISSATPSDTSTDGSTTTAVPTTTVPAWTLDEMLEMVHEYRGERRKVLPTLTPCSTLPQINRGTTLCGCGYVDLYNVFEQVPTSWTSYSYNESLMARYNYYVDVNRYTPDDGGWNAPNGESEICGWIDSDTLEDVFDASARWSSGGRGLCMYWMVGSGCGEISEADIFLNPDKTFVYDFDDSFGTTDQWHFQKTMIHEMGHAIGFETGSCGAEAYQYNRPTLMFNNQTYHVEYPVGLHRRDAKLLRMLYDDQTSEESIRDIGVESYYADGSIVNSTLSPMTLEQGDSFTIENAFVENMSNSSVSGVRLRVYLSTNRIITTNDTLVGGYTDFGTLDYDEDWRGDISRTVSYGVDPDTYYVGMMLTRNGSSYDYDDWSSNNTTWVADQLTVTEGDGLFNDIIMVLLNILPYQSSMFWVDTTGAGDDPEPPYCPGFPPMGPSVFWQIDTEDDGELEVGVAEPAEVGEGFVGGGEGLTDTVAIYELNAAGVPTELVGLSCSTNENGPAVAQVFAGKSYQVRIGGQGSSPTAGWYEAYVRPYQPLGSRPRYAISLTESRPWSNESMLDVPFELPCIQGSTMGMWFRKYAAVAGEMTLSTCSPDTNFPHVLSIHKANPQLTTLGCTTSFESKCQEGYGAEITGMVEANTFYFVRVGGVDGTTGTFRLDLNFTAETSQNSKCETAIEVEPGLHAFNTMGAQGDGAMLCDQSSTSNKAAWFSITPTEQGIVRATTCPDDGGDSQTETLVTMYLETCIDSVAKACNNIPCDGVHGGAELQVGAGETVLIRVAPLPSNLGDGYVAGELLIDIISGCLGDLNGDANVDIADILALISAWGDCEGCAADLDGDGTVGVADMLIVIGAWGPCS